MPLRESTEKFVAAFDQQRSAGAVPPWLDHLRHVAIERFAAIGFPTTKDEEWKHTNVAPAISLPFGHANGVARTLAVADVLAGSFVESGAPRMVFVNGAYAAELSSAAGLPGGVRLGSLAEPSVRNDPVLPAQLGRYADFRRNAFIALNTAFVHDGAVIAVAPGCRLTQPVYLVYLSTAPQRPIASHPRTLILSGADSEVQIVESYAGLGGGQYLCNPVTELVGEAGSVVHYCRLQREGAAGSHVGIVTAHLANGAHLTANAVTLSGALVRNDVYVSLRGAGAECVLNGLYVGDDQQHIDNFTEIEHAQPRATSLELYKGVLAAAAHGVFNGKIIVQKDAQKTDARQINKNLLLSADAVVNTKPQLEIYADDVKCSHGSTIGQLDPDALFYLRARGLAPDDARSLLSFGFASDIVGRIKVDALRRRLDDDLLARFRRI
jgi:Fe-S cluster assembly protein SufD